MGSIAGADRFLECRVGLYPSLGPRTNPASGIFRRSGRSKHSVFMSLTRVGVTLAFAIPLIFLSAPAATSVVVDLTRGTMYEKKVRDIMYSLDKSENVGTVQDRSNRYTISLNKFVSSPIVGVLSLEEVGKHSAIIDRLAMYGIFFGGMFIYCLGGLPLRLMAKKGSLGFGLSATVAMVTLTFAALNNVFPAFGVGLFILFPVAVDMVDEKERNRRLPVPVPASAPEATPALI